MARTHDNRRDSAVDPVADVGVFILGGIVGSLIGTLAAIWLAPRSGVDTRDDIRQRGLELREQAEHAAAGARERVEGPSTESILRDAKAAARSFNASR